MSIGYIVLYTVQYITRYTYVQLGTNCSHYCTNTTNSISYKLSGIVSGIRETLEKYPNKEFLLKSLNITKYIELINVSLWRISQLCSGVARRRLDCIIDVPSSWISSSLYLLDHKVEKFLPSQTQMRRNAFSISAHWVLILILKNQISLPVLQNIN